MKNNKTSLFTKVFLTFALVFALTLAGGIQSKAATKPSPITDLKQTEASDTSVEVSWSCLGNNIRFKVEISAQPSGNWTVVNEDEYSSPSRIYNLAAGKEYYVRVTPYYEDWETDIKTYGDTSAPIKVVTAPNTKTAKITHTKSTTNTIKINWQAVPGADIYTIKYRPISGKEMTCKTTGTSITLKNLTKNSEYYIGVEAGKKYADGTNVAWSGTTASIYAAVKPTKVTGVAVTNYWQSLGEIYIDHKNFTNADGYQYQLYTAYKDKDTKVKSVTTKSSSGVFFKASALKKYNFYKIRVRAYTLNSKNEKMYGEWSSWKYTSPQPDITKAKSVKSKKGIEISWDKVKGANRYVVYVSTKKNSGYKKFATTSKTKTVITKYGKNKLKKGKTYYYYVVAQKKVNNKYQSGDDSYYYYKKY